MNLTIEQMREIVDGAPESNFPVKWGLGFKAYFRQVGYFVEQWHEGKWQTLYFDPTWVDLETLRAAIADHERTDHVSDIRNHIVPTTRVIEG
ncbi:hypothetical protein [Acinetobacter sp. YH12069]|uniref:hypothetical protein n=1 Tax=Acinetobacter sp. YH12069 TaxID=2601065 RepID=UPI0015D3686B|nr:hypothetical protein [Acinetobacter sp. YH12069]